MSNEIVKFSNQFNNVALKKFDAVHLDVLMAIASRVREKGTATVEFSFEELRGLIARHAELTESTVAAELLADWPAAAARFTIVMPTDYRRVLETRAAALAEGLDEDQVGARIMEVLYG